MQLWACGTVQTMAHIVDSVDKVISVADYWLFMSLMTALQLAEHELHIHKMIIHLLAYTLHYAGPQQFKSMVRGTSRLHTLRFSYEVPKDLYL